MVPETKLGVYRHYKGGFYKVSDVAQDENADEFYVYDEEGDRMPFGSRRVVVYVVLGLKPGLRTRVRTEEEFHEQLCLAHLKNGKPQPFRICCTRAYQPGTCRMISRFEYMGAGLSDWMLAETNEHRAMRI